MKLGLVLLVFHLTPFLQVDWTATIHKVESAESETVVEMAILEPGAIFPQCVGSPIQNWNLVKVRQFGGVYWVSVQDIHTYIYIYIFFFSPSYCRKCQQTELLRSVAQLHCDAVLPIECAFIWKYLVMWLSGDHTLHIQLLHCFTFLDYPMQALLKHLATGLLIRWPQCKLMQFGPVLQVEHFFLCCISAGWPRMLNDVKEANLLLVPLLL